MAQKLKFGNGVWANKEGSTLAYNDENGNYKPLPFNFTRSTSATRVNKQGLIEVVKNNKPRIDYKDSAKGALLLEPARTNSIIYSQDFDNADWVKSATSVTANDVVSPDGSQNADLITEDTATGEHRVQDVLGLTSGISYTFSVFAKDNGRGFIRLRLENSGVGSGQINAFFDLQNGLTPTSGASIEYYGNGWYRCIATGTTNTTTYLAKINLANSDSSVSYTGDGTSGVYLWGAQLEAGSYSTSIIPTQGAAVTRVAETASGSGNSEVFNDSEGVLFVETKGLDNTISSNRKIVLGDGSFNNGIEFSYQTTTNKMQFIIRSGGIIYMNIETTSFDVTEFSKVAISYKSNQGKVFVNGIQVGITDTSVTTPIGISKLDLKFSSAFDFEGNVKDLIVYNTSLTDQELIALTTL